MLSSFSTFCLTLSFLLRKNSRLYRISAHFNVSARYLLLKYNSFTQGFYGMRLSKKKIVVFLLIIALCSSAGFVYSAQSDANESAKSLFDNSGSPNDSTPGFTLGSDDNRVDGELFFKMILMVLLVVVLGAGAIYLSKRFLPRFTRLSGKRIQVCETVHLGPRKAIHLIKIGTQALLIGSTNENITRLADVTDELSEVDSPAEPIGNN